MTVTVSFAHRGSDWLTVGFDQVERPDGSASATLRAILFDDRLGPVLIESVRGWRAGGAGKTGDLHQSTHARTLGRSPEFTTAVAADRAWMTPRSLSAMARKRLIPAMHAALDAEQQRTIADYRRAAR